MTYENGSEDGMRARSTAALRTRVLWSLVDIAIWALSLTLALRFRLDFVINDMYAGPLLSAVIAAAVMHLSLGWIWGPYAVGHELGSFEETAELSRTTLTSGAVTSVLVLVIPVITIPSSVPLSGTAMAITGMFAARFLVRSRRDARSGPPVDAKGALAREIEARHLWKPMHLQPVHASRRMFSTGASEELFATGVRLPSGSALSDEEVGLVVTTLHQSLAVLTRLGGHARG